MMLLKSFILPTTCLLLFVFVRCFLFVVVCLLFVCCCLLLFVVFSLSLLFCFVFVVEFFHYFPVSC